MFVSQALTPRVKERNKAQGDARPVDGRFNHYPFSVFGLFGLALEQFLKSMCCQFNFLLKFAFCSDLILKFEILMTMNDLFSDCTLFNNHIIEKKRMFYTVLTLISFDLVVGYSKWGNSSCQFVILTTVREITEKSVFTNF